MNLLVNPVITDFQQDVDGTIKKLKLGQEKEDAYANIIGQAEGADLDNNKTATINVSTYTEPVVINPTSGKDGMKKATVTLSNIPSGGSALYCWKDEDNNFCYTTTTTPTTSDYVYEGQTIGEIAKDDNIVEVGEDTITREWATVNTIFTRYSTGDITF